MFPKKVIDQIGLLDENYFFYNEELDYLTRVRQAGFETWFLPEAQIVHLGGQSTQTRKYDFELEGIQGTFYYLSKFHRWGYPFYRLFFSILSIPVCCFKLLWASTSSEKKFFSDILKLAFTWRRKTYQPRKYFD